MRPGEGVESIVLLEEEKEPEKGTEKNSFERQKGTRAGTMAIKQSTARSWKYLTA